jgi:hypothetical protein
MRPSAFHGAPPFTITSSDIFLKVGGRMIKLVVDKKRYMNISSRQKKFERTGTWLNKLAEKNYLSRLREYGERGVQALSAATPKDTGKTASSWYYDIYDNGKGIYNISWNNSNVNHYVNIALVLQFGHATRPETYIDKKTGKVRHRKTGGWVEGIDYINPALRPIFDEMFDDIRMEISSKVK